MAHHPTAGDSVPPVRYYPRRIRRGVLAKPVTPSQALHLPVDPQRADRARATAEHRHLTPPPPPLLQAPLQPPARPAPGRLRRWLQRLTRR